MLGHKLEVHFELLACAALQAALGGVNTEQTTFNFSNRPVFSLLQAPATSNLCLNDSYRESVEQREWNSN